LQSPFIQIVRSGDAQSVDLGSFGARFLLDQAQAGGRVSVVEHWIPPRMLAAPLHRHSREDEFSVVLAGRMGARLGEKTIVAEPGDLVLKPRDQWHTFWNAGEDECRLIEIICPGGFEEMFREIGANPDAMTGEAAAALDARFGLEVDYSSIESICAEQNLSFPA
jgi:mannose-6-phosphate isomerase-like protein (cupin superfamily)